jgi:hypothetical protein
MQKFVILGAEILANKFHKILFTHRLRNDSILHEEAGSSGFSLSLEAEIMFLQD